MAKRFGDTDIWKKQRWFRKLSPEYKLAFCYIKDQCDHAGIWNIDCTDLIEDLGITEFDLPDFVNKCNIEFDKNNGQVTLKERLRLLDKGYLWVIGFIQFQYKGKEGLVNPYANPVKTALLLIKGYGLLDEALSKKWITLTQPLDEIPDYWLRAKDKDKDNNTLHNLKHNKLNNNAESQKKMVEDMIVKEMMKVWKKHNPNYPDNDYVDFPHLLNIAYNIAKAKGWEQQEVINGRLESTLISWETIVKFIRKDSFYKKFDLSSINGKWAGLTQTMQAEKEAGQNKVTQPKIVL